MSSLVEELQAEALRPETRAADLLRKALVVASKLDIVDMQNWIERELEGYNSIEDEEMPDYRRLHGRLMGFNPYQGWVPAQMSDNPLQSEVSRHLVRENVSQIEHLLASDNSLVIEFSAGAQVVLRELFNVNWLFQLHLSKSSFVAILDNIKNRILTWGLKLQASGIAGEGLSFSIKEKAMAQSITVNGNVGVLGNTSGPSNIASTNSAVTQTLNPSRILLLAKEIKESLPRGQNAQNEELCKCLNALVIEAEQPNPDQSGMRTALQAVKGAAGRVGNALLEAGVRAMIDKAMG